MQVYRGLAKWSREKREGGTAGRREGGREKLLQI